MKQDLKKYFIVLLLLLALILIRFFEKELFNDGLINFFKYDYLTKSLPNVSWVSIITIDAFRYLVNTGFSIAILYILFKQKGLLQFLFWFYLVLFVFATILLAYFLNNYEKGQYLSVFYSRRILIQPLALLLLVPALLYQKKEAAK